MDGDIRFSSPDMCTLPSDLTASVLDLAKFTCRLLPLKVSRSNIFAEIFPPSDLFGRFLIP